MAFKVQGRDARHQRGGETSRWRPPAQVSSVLAALALTLAFPVLGTPVLAGLGVVMVWVSSRAK